MVAQRKLFGLQDRSMQWRRIHAAKNPHAVNHSERRMAPGGPSATPASPSSLTTPHPPSAPSSLIALMIPPLFSAAVRLRTELSRTQVGGPFGPHKYAYVRTQLGPQYVLTTWQIISADYGARARSHLFAKWSDMPLCHTRMRIRICTYVCVCVSEFI